MAMNTVARTSTAATRNTKFNRAEDLRLDLIDVERRFVRLKRDVELELCATAGDHGAEVCPEHDLWRLRQYLIESTWAARVLSQVADALATARVIGDMRRDVRQPALPGLSPEDMVE